MLLSSRPSNPQGFLGASSLLWEGLLVLQKEAIRHSPRVSSRAHCPLQPFTQEPLVASPVGRRQAPSQPPPSTHRAPSVLKADPGWRGSSIRATLSPGLRVLTALTAHVHSFRPPHQPKEPWGGGAGGGQRRPSSPHTLSFPCIEASCQCLQTPSPQPGTLVAEKRTPSG